MSDIKGNPSLASLTELDRVVHEPARLAVMALLYVIDSADFIFLMNQTGLTWGNLSAHMSKLEEAGYVSIEKTYRGRVPLTLVRLTPAGAAALKEYRAQLREFLSGTPRR